MPPTRRHLFRVRSPGSPGPEACPPPAPLWPGAPSRPPPPGCSLRPARTSPTRAGKRATSGHISRELGKSCRACTTRKGPQRLTFRLSPAAGHPGVGAPAFRKCPLPRKLGGLAPGPQGTTLNAEHWRRGQGKRFRARRVGAGPAFSAPGSGLGRGLGPLSQWVPRSGPLPRFGWSRRRAAAGEIVSDVPRRGPGFPGPSGPRAPRGAPGRKPDTQCGHQLHMRRPSVRQVPSPSPLAFPARKALRPRPAPRKARRGAPPAPGV